MRVHTIATLCGLALLPVRVSQADDALFQRLGGMAGLQRIMSDTVDRASHDPRIAWSFDNTNLDRLKHRLAEHACSLTGGPCTPPDRSMGAVHRHLALAERDFNALVEDLQDAMDEAGVSFRTQLQLLALMAPMKREIVAP